MKATKCLQQINGFHFAQINPHSSLFCCFSPGFLVSLQRMWHIYSVRTPILNSFCFGLVFFANCWSNFAFFPNIKLYFCTYI